MKQHLGLKLDQLASALLVPINTSAIIIMGIYTTVWGVWLGNPLWSKFYSSEIYSVMHFLPAIFWGSVAVAAGIAVIYGVLRHSYTSLVTGALVGFYHWFIVCILLVLGDWADPGFIAAVMVMIYCAFIYLNLRTNKDLFVSRQ